MGLSNIRFSFTSIVCLEWHKVIVVNTDSDKVVGVILKTEGVHGIAIADEFDRAFISNGRVSTVSVIN